MYLKLTYLTLLLCLLLPVTAPAAVGVAAPVELTETLDRAEVETALGRKLTWRERISLSFAKRKARRAAEVQDGASQGNGMAIAGFVCGIVGLFVAGVILGPLAIVFSAIGMSKARREGRPLRGLAIAGLVIGIVATVGGLIAIAMLT